MRAPRHWIVVQAVGSLHTISRVSGDIKTLPVVYRHPHATICKQVFGRPMQGLSGARAACGKWAIGDVHHGAMRGAGGFPPVGGVGAGFYAD